MDCKGLHCPGCGHGGSGFPAGGLAVLAGLALAVAERHTIGQAVSEVVHVIIVIVIIVVSLAVVSVAAVVAVRLRRRSRARAHAGITASQVWPLSGRVVPRELPPGREPVRMPWESPADYWARLPRDQRHGPDPYGRD